MWKVSLLDVCSKHWLRWFIKRFGPFDHFPIEVLTGKPIFVLLIVAIRHFLNSWHREIKISKNIYSKFSLNNCFYLFWLFDKILSSQKTKVIERVMSSTGALVKLNIFILLYIYFIRESFSLMDFSITLPSFSKWMTP